MTRRIQVVFAVVPVMLLLLSACSKEEAVLQQQGSPQPSDVLVQKAPVSERDFRSIIVNVAKANIPAVVHIEVTQRQEVANPFARFEPDPFRRFFELPQMPKKFRRETRGIGTGMIIDDQGYILTNNHVVTGSTRIQVILSNERRYEARMVGFDTKTDLAVIKVSADEKLPYVTFGDSDRVEVGEWVVAIGHPRGLDQTVTQGIISAKHREGITDPNTYQDFLQTDAAINPGNSGGPLINLDGHVIGVNSIIASQSGGFEGIGFAIPSNMALFIANSLIKTGKVQRGWLGITLKDVSFEEIKSLSLDAPRGALVVEVVKGGPASKAGLKEGDVIVDLGGNEIADSSALRNKIAGTPSGSEVDLGIMRDGQRTRSTVRVGSFEEAARIMVVSMRERLGVEVRQPSGKERTRYGLDEDQGVVITRLDPGGPMAEAGFEVNDVILQVSGQPIQGTEDFISIAGAMEPGEGFTLFAIDHRTGRSGTIQVAAR